jgi:hypothetical protein
VTQEVECEIKTLEEVVDASTVQPIQGAIRCERTTRLESSFTRGGRSRSIYSNGSPRSDALFSLDGFDVAGGGIVISVPERFAAATVVADAGVNARRHDGSREESGICGTGIAAPWCGSPASRAAAKRRSHDR